MAFMTRKDAKEAGWFSRRHRTNEAHRAAGDAWRETRGKDARRRRAVERAVS